MEKVELVECLETASADLNHKDKQTKSIDTKYPWIIKDVS